MIVGDSVLSELVTIFEMAHPRNDLRRAADRIRSGDFGRTTKRLARCAALHASICYTSCRDTTKVLMLYAAASAAEAIRLIATQGPDDEIEAEITSAKSHTNQETRYANERALRSG